MNLKNNFDEIDGIETAIFSNFVASLKTEFETRFNDFKKVINSRRRVTIEQYNYIET